MSAQATEIRCPACGCLFGVEVGNKLNIKHRDLFRAIRGGTVSGPCRRCGELVVWPSKGTIQKKGDP